MNFRHQQLFMFILSLVFTGLKRVTSLPVGIESQTEFIAGTKNDVEFYYMSTCCYTTVEVTATDVQGNIHVRKIDVTGMYLTDIK